MALEARVPSTTQARALPFFYGWAIVGAGFVTMALGVNARNALFSLLYPALLAEFGWERGVTVGAFSLGFVFGAALTPFLGRLMDRRGPRVVIEAGVVMMAAGLVLAPLVSRPCHLYATLGLLVGGGGVPLGYTGQALFLPNWFERRRAFAMSLTYSGVGVGSIALLPWLQSLIVHSGWRAASVAMGILILVVLLPLNLLLRRRPQDMGLEPDGARTPPGLAARARMSNVVDPVWAARDWTLRLAAGTGRFWWIAVGYFCGMVAWYSGYVHQTKYLLEIGFSAAQAAWALGSVSLVAIPGQIAMGYCSDRIGREWVWTAGCAGFALCYVTLLVLPQAPGTTLLGLMVASQGLLGYGLTSVIGAIPAEIFAGRELGATIGALMLAASLGGAAGPWVTGLLYDATGSYAPGFTIALGACALSAASVWRAAPRKVRAVAGRAGIE